MNTKIIACTVGFALFGWAAFAETFTAIKDASDWSQKESFTVNGAPATRTPGAGDTVLLVGGGTWAFTNDTAGAAAFNVMANVKEIRYSKDTQAFLEITVPSGEATLNCAIYPQNDNACYRFCDIVKKGEGTLKLVAGANFISYVSGSAQWVSDAGKCVYSFYVNIRVQEGVLRLLPDCVSLTCYTGIIDVSDGAKFYLPNRNAGGNFTCQCRGVKGAGTIANDQPTNPVLDPMVAAVQARELTDGQMVFSGTLVDEHANGGMRVRWSGPQKVTGGKSTNRGPTLIWSNGYAWTKDAPDGYGVTMTDQFGMRGQPSSFGAGSEINFQWLGGELWYGGNGETTDKKFIFSVPGEDNKMPIIFNAGAVGGVTFDGSDYAQTQWCAGDTSSSGYFHDVRVILSGANANPMHVKCPVNCGTYYVNNNPAGVMTPYFLKRGSGAWSFENDASGMQGSFEIDAGAIRFTSIDESGYASALGRSMRLYNFLDGLQTRAALDASKVSPFAVTLATTNAATRGTLEYVGAKASGSSDRKIGLAGFGGKIANNGQGSLLLNGVTVRDANLATTLVLGGTNADDNVLFNVTNGVGSIALVKEDSGKWTLADNLDVDSVEVKGGTLVLERTTGKSYSWFKFIMKEARNFTEDNGGKETAPAWPCLEEFILQDADGNRVFTNPVSYDVAVGGTTSAESYRAVNKPGNYHGICPNGVAYGCRGTVTGGGWQSTKLCLDDRLVTNLFDNAKSVSSAGFWPDRYNASDRFASTTCSMTTNTPDKWIEVVMRLPTDAPHVAACDLVAGTGGGWQNELSAWGLEGSRDGIHWETVTNYNSKFDGTIFEDDKHTDHFNKHRSGNEYWSLADKYGYRSGMCRWNPGDTKAPHPNGYPFPGVVTNEFAFPTSLDFVKISGGGTLKIDSTVPVTIDTLTVDATTGGSVVNGTYASTGTLTFENVGDDPRIEVPGTFAGLNLEGWTVNLPTGKTNREVTVREDGSLVITKRGLLLIIK